MENVFKNYTLRSIDNVSQSVPQTDTVDIILGVSVSNVSNDDLTFNVFVKDADNNNTHLVMGSELPASTNAQLITGNSKLILNADDQLFFSSTGSVDVLVSVMENVTS